MVIVGNDLIVDAVSPKRVIVISIPQHAVRAHIVSHDIVLKS